MTTPKTKAQINGDKPASEMTKRELIAMHLAASGLITRNAVDDADLLLQTLEETKQ